MKKLCDLSKNELMSLVLNNFEDITTESELECMICGEDNKNPDFVCDECNANIKTPFGE